MGTTKLTRKEILAEDPVHQAIIQLIEFFRVNGKKIAIGAAVIVLLAVGVYVGTPVSGQQAGTSAGSVAGRDEFLPRSGVAGCLG